MNYLSLIIEFFKTGLFAVGGGLATIPFLKEITKNYNWFTTEQLTDMIAVSESTPGPIGVNMATYAGFNAEGFFGAVLATLALVFPSIVVITIVSRFMKKFRSSVLISGAFVALRPASTGLIAGAMFPVLVNVVTPILIFGSDYNPNHQITGINIFPLLLYIVFTTAYYFSEKLKKPLHPIIFIGIGAVLGVVLEL